MITSLVVCSLAVSLACRAFASRKPLSQGFLLSSTLFLDRKGGAAKVLPLLSCHFDRRQQATAGDSPVAVCTKTPWREARSSDQISEDKGKAGHLQGPLGPLPPPFFPFLPAPETNIE